jgi:hypothetical protein
MRYFLRFGVILRMLVATAVPCLGGAAGSGVGQFDLVGVTFDDGGEATGTFDFNTHWANMPLPQFYNMQIVRQLAQRFQGLVFP